MGGRPAWWRARCLAPGKMAIKTRDGWKTRRQIARQGMVTTSAPPKPTATALLMKGAPRHHATDAQHGHHATAQTKHGEGRGHS